MFVFVVVVIYICAVAIGSKPPPQGMAWNGVIIDALRSCDEGPRVQLALCSTRAAVKVLLRLLGEDPA